jgi:hypothetical protein
VGEIMKGVLFTIMTLLFMTLLLSFATLFLATRENAVLQQATMLTSDRVVSTTANIATTYLQTFNLTSVDVYSNGSATSLFFGGRSPILSYSAALTTLTSTLNTHLRQSGINISVSSADNFFTALPFNTRFYFNPSNISVYTNQPLFVEVNISTNETLTGIANTFVDDGGSNPRIVLRINDSTGVITNLSTQLNPTQANEQYSATFGVSGSLIMTYGLVSGADGVYVVQVPAGVRTWMTSSIITYTSVSAPTIIYGNLTLSGTLPDYSLNSPLVIVK